MIYIFKDAEKYVLVIIYIDLNEQKFKKCDAKIIKKNETIRFHKIKIKQFNFRVI